MFEAPEGATPLDPNELGGLKHSHVATRNELNELEQANIEEALRWLSKSRSRDILTDDFIRELHLAMFGQVWNWAGQYRMREKNIGVAPYQIVTELRMLIDDAKHWAEKSTYEPLEAAARFHHRLVKIHPFPNGNGRHARIATDLYLEKYLDHEKIDWSKGKDMQADGDVRDEYIRALRNADMENYDGLLRFVGAK